MRLDNLIHALTTTRPGAAILTLTSWGFLAFCLYALAALIRAGEPWYGFLLLGVVLFFAAFEAYLVTFVFRLPVYALTGRR